MKGYVISAELTGNLVTVRVRVRPRKYEPSEVCTVIIQQRYAKDYPVGRNVDVKVRAL